MPNPLWSSGADIRRSVTAVAPAKINLHLGVGDLRPDGFHDLTTVYRAVDLWEKVTVSHARPPEPGQGHVVTVSGPDRSLVPLDETNLAFRAVAALLAENDVHGQVATIHIEKGVPVAGGMAGGSADAAAALVAADRLYDFRMGREKLLEIAAGLGSDVPFCLHGGTALGSGRGEELTDLLRAEVETHVVAATARQGLSTPEVFRELDTLREEGDPSRVGGYDDLLRSLASGTPAAVAAHLGNDLEAAALSLRPELRRTLRAGEAAGALRAMLSGSGPTCLFFCADRDAAVDVAAAVAESGTAREVRVTRGPVPGAHITEID